MAAQQIVKLPGNHVAGAENPALQGDDASQSPWLLYSGRQQLAFLLVLFLVGASYNIDRNILGVLLPQIKIEFALSDTELGLLSGIVFAFFYATLGLPLARMADRGNRVHILSYSLVAWSVMTALCGLAQSFWQLVAARIGVGAGEAGAFPAAQSLIADYFAPAKRAGAMAVFMTSSAIGYGGGLILGGYVAEHYGWRSAFLLVGVVGIILGPISLSVLKEPRKAFRAKVVTEPFRAAAIGLFKVPAYRNILYAIVIYFFMSYGALVFIVSAMMRLFDVNVQVAGATFGTITMMSAIVGNISGGLIANRLARKNLANLPRTAACAMMATVPLFIFALSRSSMAEMEIPLALAMVALNMMSAPMFASLYLVCGPNRRATAVAIVLLFANLVGLGLGPFVTGLISDFLAPTMGAAEGLRTSLLMLFGVMIIGGIFMLRAANHIEASIKAEHAQSLS
ncbi:MFS transporter [Sphingopyxis sp. JAI128]|uniref:spinster family MFS transporter n=1 Tax=Sphingopyxis sp. JAI128 TaxID=2723066 RepID=UPI0016169446|nr:MFS transporter [Sphingopyxis sp. JAI128]MBB6427881.1 MFS family permease [Sphingopyxis sp. JAI128]